MREGGVGLFPIIYDDTLMDFDVGKHYMPKTARPWTKERAALKDRQAQLEKEQKD